VEAVRWAVGGGRVSWTGAEGKDADVGVIGTANCGVVACW